MGVILLALTKEKEMKDIDAAVRQEIERLKGAIAALPELRDEYINQGYGVFALWLNLAGYADDDENETIAAMRDLSTKL